MGLLDDAIREHLELKRRRGADPSEIEREESEALGPVRREAPGADSGAAAAVAEDHGGSFADHHDGAGLDEPAGAYDDEFGFDDAPAAPAAEHAVPSDPPATHDAPFAEREDESSTPPHGDPYQATREFSATELGEALGHHETSAPPHGDPVAPPPAAPAAHDAVPADEDPEPDADDELQDTPDFLQETPEHDRLWFEQKPPKDFDF
ncbi:hypothetical protein [Conexibacter woesei]|uniref:hypothetical protein n=1 Tax=Conexibacter woesei TaxID=191495 RepID=UPI00041B6410|nr:hypothetical protein [Conexibacter woesei]